jgi:hypothetical protein
LQTHIEQLHGALERQGLQFAKCGCKDCKRMVKDLCETYEIACRSLTFAKIAMNALSPPQANLMVKAYPHSPRSKQVQELIGTLEKTVAMGHSESKRTH